MKREPAFTILIGVAVGVYVVVCLALINPWFTFFGLLLVIPVVLCIFAVAPVTRCEVFDGVSTSRAMLGGILFAVALNGLPFAIGFAEARLRGPPLPVPEDAYSVRNRGFGGGTRIYYTLDAPPDRVEMQVEHQAGDAGWVVKSEGNYGRFYANEGQILLVKLTPAEGGTTVFLFQRHPKATPVISLLLLGIGYVVALFYALTHPARQGR